MKVPKDIFPKTIQYFIDKSEKSLGLNTDFMTTTLLSLFSVIIGSKIKLEVKNGWTVQSNLWLAIVGKSGVKKSPTIKHILKPLQELDKKNYDAFCKEFSEYQKSISDGEKGLSKPTYKQLLVDDTTTEALYKVMQNNPNGLLMSKDELVTLFSDGKRYDGGGQEDKLLSIYDGDTVKINRKTNEEVIRLSSVFLSLIGGIQPEILINNASKTRIYNGFMARMLFCYPTDLQYQVINSNNDLIGEEEYNRFITASHITVQKEKNIIIPLSSEARNAYLEWCKNFIEPKMNNSKTPPFETAYLSKGENTILKLALILEFIWSIETEEKINSVNLSNFLKAKDLIEYFYENFKNIQQLIGEEKVKLTPKQSQLLLSHLEAIENKYSKQESVAMLIEEGYSNSEIHSTLNIPKATISDWKKKWDLGKL